MISHKLVQGSPEWRAHRATHLNASDAAAMLGCSPHMTRAQLLHKLHTGVSAEVDPMTQRRFDDGHRFEALARPLAEKIIEDDLAPVVGTMGELSASFDGLTLMGDTAFEHKTLNNELRAVLKETPPALPKHYRAQMEQQLLVSGAERVLFMATSWDGDNLVEEAHCWYEPDAALRAEIVNGWKQFAADLAAYVPSAAAAIEKVVAEPVEALPAPVVQVSGQLTLQDNFRVFEDRLRHFLEHKLIRQPKTDQDFVDLDAQIKAMKQAREALGAAETQMLAQVEPVDRAKKTKDMLDKLLQQNLSMAERLLKDEKERRRGEIVAGGIAALREHVAALNTRLGQPYMPIIPADFAGCVKGLKSLASMEDKVSGELARCKIAANEIADRIQINMRAILAVGDSAHFPDAAALVLKAPDDCAAVIAARVAETERRLQAQRERIRLEEVARIDREQQAEAARVERERKAAEHNAAGAEAMNNIAEARKAGALPEPVLDRLENVASGLIADLAIGRAANPPTVVPIRPAVDNRPNIRLGQIADKLGFTVTADFLKHLGFEPVATEKAAKLYRASDETLIYEALVAHIRTVAAKAVQLQAA